MKIKAITRIHYIWGISDSIAKVGYRTGIRKTVFDICLVPMQPTDISGNVWTNNMFGNVLYLRIVQSNEYDSFIFIRAIENFPI